MSDNKDIEFHRWHKTRSRRSLLKGVGGGVAGGLAVVAGGAVGVSRLNEGDSDAEARKRVEALVAAYAEPIQETIEACIRPDSHLKSRLDALIQIDALADAYEAGYFRLSALPGRIGEFLTKKIGGEQFDLVVPQGELGYIYLGTTREYSRAQENTIVEEKTLRFVVDSDQEFIPERYAGRPERGLNVTYYPNRHISDRLPSFMGRIVSVPMATRFTPTGETPMASEANPDSFSANWVDGGRSFNYRMNTSGDVAVGFRQIIVPS